MNKRNTRLSKEELDDYKYLYEDEFIDNESELDLEYANLDIRKIENYDYIKNVKVFSEEEEEYPKLLLDKDDLEELDKEFIGTDINLEKNEESGCEVKRKAEPPKEPLSKKEKDEIAEQNMALVHYVIKSLHNTQIEYNELFSIAIIGYAKALESYDKSKKVKFSTYAINCIRNEIFYVLRKEKKHIENTISLNKVLSVDKNGNSLQLGETISEENVDSKSLEDLILDGENRTILLKALGYLKKEERFILIYRYGLDKGIIKTQKEIAEIVGMSQANVSKIEKSCLNKLKLILKKEMRTI